MIETLLWPTLGGLLIGLAAAAMMFWFGRIAGISGILGGLLSAGPGDRSWRALFVAGLVAGGGILMAVAPEAITAPDRSLVAIGLAGLAVGFGTRLGSGCTSGHGVCGIARTSRRSIVATVTFMITGVLTATAVRHLFGGSV